MNCNSKSRESTKAGMASIGWPSRAWLMVATLCLGLCCATSSLAGDDLMPLQLKLPAPMFVGTPKDQPANANLEPPSDKPRPPLMVPKDVLNLAPASKLSTSDTKTDVAKLPKIVDGNKEPSDNNTVFLRKGTQY